jgi:dTDP-4-dehydrorhamnose reductase
MGDIVVTGASGQLGTAFQSHIPEARFLTRADLDLSEPATIGPALERLDAAAIINCAAYTAVDAAEENDEMALTVNGRAVSELAGAADRAGIPFVTYSTDYVFDGSGTRPYVESDGTDPINAYGRSKLVGERAALAHPGSLVIRTSWVISGTHPNFVATMLRLAQQRPLSVVNDQWGCPTIASDLAGATLRAMEVGATGLLHLTNQGPTTWFELARTALHMGGLDPARITPCATEDYPTPARRPAYSVLTSERLAALGMRPLKHWRASLAGVVAALLEVEGSGAGP